MSGSFWHQEGPFYWPPGCGASAKVLREQANKKLFDAGKINAAQLVALNEGKSAFDIIALSENMNNGAKGAEGNKETIELSESEKKIADQLGLTAEEYKAQK